MPAIGDSPGAAEGARGQGDAGVARQDLGVLVEGLVEVAQAVEKDRAGVLRLQIEVLPPRGNERFPCGFPFARHFTGAIGTRHLGAGHGAIIRVGGRRSAARRWRVDRVEPARSEPATGRYTLLLGQEATASGRRLIVQGGIAVACVMQSRCAPRRRRSIHWLILPPRPDRSEGRWRAGTRASSRSTL